MADASAFDPTVFLGSEVIQSGFETHMTKVPAGDYQAIIDSVNSKHVEVTVEGGGKEKRLVMAIVWNVLDEEVKKSTELDKPTVRQDIWIDINEAGTGLATGKNKNIGLGNLLEAFGLNNGKPWSPNGLVGNMATIKVIEQLNKEDPENPYVKVAKVARAA